MDLPVLLPKHLAYLEEIESENKMLKVLVKRPSDLVLFLQHACSDQAWGIHHKTILSKLITWLTFHYLKGMLALEIAQKSRDILIEHARFLSSIIQKDITLLHNGHSYPVNSLLFGMSSPLFREYIREQCTENESRVLELFEGSQLAVEALVEFVHTGEVKNFWRRDQKEVLALLKESSNWEVADLEHYCTEIYKRYIHTDNVVGLLCAAHQNSWKELEHQCKNYINHLEVGARFYDDDGLAMEVQRFSKECLQLYEELASEIEFLSFTGDLTTREEFSFMVTHTPSLVGLKLSHTTTFSELLEEIPESVEQLDLSKCEWLSAESMERLITSCPHIRVLKLANNTQLDHEFWVLLSNLQNLEYLSLSNCQQINEENLLLIARGTTQLLGIHLDHCDRITEQGFMELAKSLPSLEVVTLSYTSVTNEVIAELASHCPRLRSLSLEKCREISDRGITEAVKIAINLSKLNLISSSISPGCIEQIRELYPYLEIITS